MPSTAAALCEPADGPDPRLHRVQGPEVDLLRAQVRPGVMAHQREEGRDCEGLVAVAQDSKVDGVPVVVQRQEGRGGVDGHHEQDPDDLLLFMGHSVVNGVHQDQVQADGHGHGGRGARDEDGQMVEGQVACQGELGVGEDCKA